MKVALLIAVVLASASLAESWYRYTKRTPPEKACQEKKKALLDLRDAAAELEETVQDDEDKAARGAMMDFQQVEGNNRALNWDTFVKKAATLQEAAADVEEMVNEAEEDAALGLLEEELEELEEELEEAKDDADE
ncbi:uncharacterized protein LOC144907080 [Branchiostoma floridae x Branchiostoma belcheri]